MHWRIMKDGLTLHRPVSAASENDARRRVMASLGLELEGISRDEFERMEVRSLSANGLPAISEACEPGEEMSAEAPCGSAGVEQCPLREKCPRWLQNARAWGVRL